MCIEQGHANGGQTPPSCKRTLHQSHTDYHHSADYYTYSRHYSSANIEAFKRDIKRQNQEFCSSKIEINQLWGLTHHPSIHHKQTNQPSIVWVAPQINELNI